MVVKTDSNQKFAIFARSSEVRDSCDLFVIFLRKLTKFVILAICSICCDLGFVRNF